MVGFTDLKGDILSSDSMYELFVKSRLMQNLNLVGQMIRINESITECEAESFNTKIFMKLFIEASWTNNISSPMFRRHDYRTYNKVFLQYVNTLDRVNEVLVKV